MRERGQRRVHEHPRAEPHREKPVTGDGLVQPHRRLGDARDALGQRAGRRHQSVTRHHLVHDPEAQRFGGIEMIPGQSVAMRGLPAGQRREQDRRVRDVTDLRLREHAVVGGNRDVARQRIPEPTAHDPAVDGGDDRLRQLPEMHQPSRRRIVVRPPALQELRDLEAARIERRLAVRAPPDVVARGERAAGAGQDDRADLRIGIGLVQRSMQLGRELWVDRVQRLRPIERERDDGSGLLVEQHLVGHR